MGMPTADVGTPTTVDACNAAAWVVYSVAIEELALAHIINAEGEKIQYFLGTLPENGEGVAGGSVNPDPNPDPDPEEPERPTFQQILDANDSVRETLQTIICKEIVLNLKLCQALHFLDEHCGEEEEEEEGVAGAPVSP